jgi:hypothetical protein
MLLVWVPILLASPGAAAAQEPELPSLVEYRSRLDIEPQVQFRTIAQRCAALYRRWSAWTASWDPEGSATARRDAGAFEAAAVRARVTAGASREAATGEVSAAIERAEVLYRDHVGGSAPTAPSLAADTFLEADLGVCRSMIELLGPQ